MSLMMARFTGRLASAVNFGAPAAAPNEAARSLP
jgi:hypothetical protein